MPSRLNYRFFSTFFSFFFFSLGTIDKIKNRKNIPSYLLQSKILEVTKILISVCAMHITSCQAAPVPVYFLLFHFYFNSVYFKTLKITPYAHQHNFAILVVSFLSWQRRCISAQGTGCALFLLQFIYFKKRSDEITSITYNILDVLHGTPGIHLAGNLPLLSGFIKNVLRSRRWKSSIKSRDISRRGAQTGRRGSLYPRAPFLGPGPFTLLSSASRVARFVLKAPNVACQVKIHCNFLNIFFHYLAKVLIRECQLETLG